jgi:hypothetical protein
MRNPLPHLVIAALACAAVAPRAFAIAPVVKKADAAPNVAFNRADWQVIDLGGASAYAPAKKACPAGTLAAMTADVNEIKSSWKAKIGYTPQIPLYCIQFNAQKQAAVSPVDTTALDLTVYTWGSEPNFVLNRGKHGARGTGIAAATVAVRLPKDDELKYAAPAPAPGDGKPEGEHPRQNPPRGGGAQTSVALSPAETYWLSQTERNAYAQSAAKASAAELVKLEHATRAQVAKYLPPFARAQYAALTKGQVDAQKTSVYLDGLLAITDPGELAKLESIKKSKTGLGAQVKLDNAKQDYETQMKTVRLADGRPVPQDRAAAVQKVAVYRGMLRALSGTPARTQPADPHAVVDLFPAELDWLTPAQLNEYQQAQAAAKTPAARKPLNKKYRDLIAANLPDSGRAEYKAAADALEAEAINAAILKVPHYAGADAELNDAEVKALAGITKDNLPKGYEPLQKENAQIDYKFLMSSLRKDDKGAFVGSAHLRAHELTTLYRGMLAAAGIKVPSPLPGETKPETTPGDVKPGDVKPGTQALSERQQKLLADLKLKDAYDKELKDAGTDPDKVAAVNLKYRKALALSDKASYDELSPEQMKDVCAPFKNAVVNGAGAAQSGDFAADGSAQAQLQTIAGALGATPAPASAQTKQTQAQAPASIFPPGTDPKVKEACVALNANTGPQNGPGPTPNVGGSVPQPATTDTEAGDAKKGLDPKFFKNLGAGMAFGVFGLVLGSFFGGPLVMAAAALVIGGGAFALSKFLNTPKKEE